MNPPVHNSMRGWFAAALHEHMEKDARIWCLTADLGYGMLDGIRDDFPERFVNVGAAEQALIGVACGLALEGRIPFCYSITPFLLCRPFEWLRNYVQHERIPVRLVGSGLDNDYEHDGITHHAYDAKRILKLLPAIRRYFPRRMTKIPAIVEKMIARDEPAFLCLRR